MFNMELRPGDLVKLYTQVATYLRDGNSPLINTEYPHYIRPDDIMMVIGTTQGECDILVYHEGMVGWIWSPNLKRL